MRGFKVDLEYELDAGGRVDLVLSRGERHSIDQHTGNDGRTVAVEISVTTGYEHELGNVRKCLDAGFERVFVVSMKRDFLKRIEKLFTESLTKKELSRVRVVPPEDLLAWLSDEPVSEGRVAGYTVRTQRSKADASGAATRRNRLADVIGESLRRIDRGDL